MYNYEASTRFSSVYDEFEGSFLNESNLPN